MISFRKKIYKIPIVLLLIFSMVVSTIFTGNYLIETQAADEAFEAAISSFPESYKSYLRALHEAHPSWTFIPFDTGLDWSEVIKNEMTLSRNLVGYANATTPVKDSNGNVIYNKVTGLTGMMIKGVDTSWYATPTSWKAITYWKKVNNEWTETDIGAFDWVYDQWVLFDSGWAQASQTAVEYVMDPRNWLRDENIFMFEQLSYNSETQTYDVLKAMMENTFMDCDDYTVEGTDGKTYADVLIEAADQNNVSPVHLCARILQEQGPNNGTLGKGVTLSSDGVNYRAAVAGDVNVYYNYFNIGASGTGTQAIINAGAKEAVAGGWTTPYLAIMGGAKKLASGYIAIGQDTLYFQKFSVVNPAYYYWKQYMQNLLAPVSEGYTAYEAYVASGILDQGYTFRIPIYNNMPESASPRPTPITGTASPNYKLASLSVSGKNMSGTAASVSLTPTFNTDTTTYSMVVPYQVSSITVNAKAYSETATVSGTGEYNLVVGANSIKVVCKSAYGESRTYTISVTRLEGSTLLTDLTPTVGIFNETFEKETYKYTFNVDNSVETLALKYSTESSIAAVQMEYNGETTDLSEGTSGDIALAEGVNTVYIKVYPSKDDKSNCSTYQVDITRYSAITVDMKELQENGSYVNNFAIGESVEAAKTRLTVENGTVKITDSEGVEKDSSAVIATGDYLEIYDANGYLYKKCQIVIYGDVNGDGKVNILDYAFLKKHHWISPFLTGIMFEASNVYPQSENVDLMDMAVLKMYIWKNGALSQIR